MYNIIDAYMKKITKEDVSRFALQKGAELNEEELDFTYNFIKKNYQEILKNPSLFDIDRYKSKYQEKNFFKIKQVFNEYYQKFGSLLK